MVSEKVVIRHVLGLHLRPASTLCRKAVEYEAKIMIHFREKEFNAKSLLSVLSACVQQGDEIELICSGTDEKEALEAIVCLLSPQEPCA